MTKECTKSKKWYTASRDRVFKAVFVNDEYKELFECILKETLKETISITKFHITELTVKTVNERVKMLDVLIEIDNNKNYIGGEYAKFHTFTCPYRVFTAGWLK